MKTLICEDQKQKLALLAVDALAEAEKPAILAHLNQCAVCRTYWDQLQGIVNLYRNDAERSIEPSRAPVPVRAVPKRELFAWLTLPRLAAAALIAVGVFLLLRQNPRPPEARPHVAAQAVPVPTPSIALAHQMVNEDFETLTEPPKGYEGPTFVFSVGTRDEGP